MAAEFVAADATAYALASDAVPDLVVVNPPRRGIGPDLAGWLETSGVRHVVYSSCNAESLARDLSQEFGVLRAPTFHYGVNLPGEETYAGTAALRAKTLHRALNELLVAWAAQGFNEFVCITANAHGPHAEAVATLRAPGGRVRVIEALSVDLAGLLTGAPGPE